MLTSSSVQRFAQQRARRIVAVQLHDAVGIVADTEFGRTAQHPVRFDATQLRAADLQIARVTPRRRARTAVTRPARTFGAPHTT